MKQVTIEYVPGDKVYDDLTRQVATVVGVSLSMGKCDKVRYPGVVIGYWLDNDHVGGGRHPWEISPLPDEKRGEHGA